jgi:NAD(P)-dependent dehydrogenase (short-subunit alcohol dehydrogenase family)
MNVKDKVIVVTGGASGIGLELCTRFTEEGARVVLSDLRQDAAESKAALIGATAVAADVGKEEDIAGLVAAAMEKFARIDMFCSNAGIAIGGEQVPAEKWQLIYDVNALSHVYAAKYVLPQMLERGDGYLLNVASAAGLLTQPGAAPYAVTKYAAVGFAEWLAITYGRRGVKVSVLRPALVAAPMIEGAADKMTGVISTKEVADDVMRAIAEERFVISTHRWVLELFKMKGNDYEQYIKVMSEPREGSAPAGGEPA